MQLLQLDAGVMTRESGVGVVVYERCRGVTKGTAGAGVAGGLKRYATDVWRSSWHRARANGAKSGFA